jgi:hypothetical protein
MLVELEMRTEALIFCHKNGHLTQGQSSMIWEQHVAEQNNHRDFSVAGFMKGAATQIILFQPLKDIIKGEL